MQPNLTRVGEVGLLQLVLLNGKTLVKNLCRLLSGDADVARDLLITANAEGSDGETSCGKRSKGRPASIVTRKHSTLLTLMLRKEIATDNEKLWQQAK